MRASLVAELAAPSFRVSNLPFAQNAARVLVEFERFRLGLYQSRPGNPDRISTRRVGDAWCLRFPAVRYFNQVQGVGDAEAERLDEIAAFYADLPAGYTLQVAPDADRAAVFSRLINRGFTIASRSVRVLHRRPRPVGLAHPPGLTLAPLQATEADEFFLLYLECFGADPRGHAAALANMRLLAGQPELHSFIARINGQAVGLGMLFVADGLAYFCAGAVRPAWRRLGLQAIFLDERLRLCAELGCELAVSWTTEGSVSHRNLLRAGFELSYLDPIWASGPRSDPARPSP